ncbi:MULTISPECIES: hypothetical protein [unclassified Lysobacter]|uniref:DUF6929 family protein n=1 Tax=unclassified Lysobacter TaxID=2635362 RepID=UPI001BE9C5E1|nr:MULTISPECIES: hypothetical protein [unclassified Lysobacter]MBT2747710.1 hypothetical protein [Lysobacter sp. ISL-42]MBT2754028.1 hypothetical protein [Lysobacter sp. ISL-50]MBT2779693.1 hypothetical protein [Lysobacter sp. ISL-54]MBT2780128.1 hypothetical protein [Lysobacter sp. ISL-52]
MIDLQPLRELRFAAARALPDRLSAASGIVAAGDFLYVVADDELHLGVFDFAGRRDGEWLRIFDGELPDEAAARKASKPDLEALARLPPFAGYPGGALLALASGSRPNRQTGVLLGLDDTGALRGEPRRVDLSALYAPLLRDLPALNLEGAVVCGQELVLLQRASGDHPHNALIRFPLAPLLHALGADGEPRLPELPADIRRVELPRIEGVALGFTDAAALADGSLVFSAVAENVHDTYNDGPCVGAAIGIAALDGQLQQLEFVRPVRKIEGIAAQHDGAFIDLLLVTDADDRGAAGVLYSARLALAEPAGLAR